MNSHNRFVNNPPYTITPWLERRKWMTILLYYPSSLDYLLRGTQNTNNQSQLTGKMGYHGSSLLAQLHQEWLKLWGSLNSTITRIKPTEGSVTVADSNAVPLSPDLTVDCLCLTVSMCDWKTRNTKKKRPDSALWILFEIRNETLKQKPNPTEARWILFLLLLVSSLDVCMTDSVCVRECARVVFLHVSKH